MRLKQMGGAMVLSTLTFLSPARALDCNGLKSAKIADTTIISAEAVPAGDLTTADKVTRKDMPAFCRVVASVKDAPDSDVQVELWMPNEGWKGVFHINGNGGYAGTLAYNYGAMEAAIKRGYASAETDLGTAPASPLNGDALVGHPDKWKDWGLLGTHEAAVAGKQIAKVFYGADAKHSYYTGCSTGGQQGIIEAEYFPEDFDGILAGAPVVNRTWGHAVAVTSYQAANLKPGHKLSDANLALLTKSAVAVCGAKANGLKSDPFIADPLACDFDPAALTCKGAAANDCLTPEQVETAKAIYLGPADKNGKPLFYGELPGSESGSSIGASLRRPATPRASRDLTVCSNGCLAPTGIGAPSTSSRTWSRSTPPSDRRSMAQSLAMSPGSATAAGNWSSSRVWRIRSCPLGRPSTSIRASRASSAAKRRRRRSLGSSWFRAWAIAASAQARTGSTLRLSVERSRQP